MLQATVMINARNEKAQNLRHARRLGYSNEQIKRLVIDLRGETPKPTTFDFLRRYAIDDGAIRCVRGDREYYRITWLLDHTWLDCSDEEIRNSLGGHWHYRGAGSSFRHEASIHRSNHSILVHQIGGLDI